MLMLNILVTYKRGTPACLRHSKCKVPNGYTSNLTLYKFFLFFSLKNSNYYTIRLIAK